MSAAKVPTNAMPVVKVLRQDVPRPKGLPMVFSPGRTLRWWRLGGIGINQLATVCCPMGLHPKAEAGVPQCVSEFPLAESFAIRAFYAWWDEQTDAQAAIDAVWGPAC